MNVATCKHKDTTFAGLARPDVGPGSLILGQWLPDEILKEFTAEKRGATKWEKRPNMPRNEAIDLSGYAQALAEHKGLLKLDPADLFDWAVGGLENTHAVVLGGPDEPARAPDPEPERPAPRRISYLE